MKKSIVLSLLALGSISVAGAMETKNNRPNAVNSDSSVKMVKVSSEELNAFSKQLKGIAENVEGLTKLFSKEENQKIEVEIHDAEAKFEKEFLSCLQEKENIKESNGVLQKMEEARLLIKGIRAFQTSKKDKAKQKDALYKEKVNSIKGEISKLSNTITQKLIKSPDETLFSYLKNLNELTQTMADVSPASAIKALYNLKTITENSQKKYTAEDERVELKIKNGEWEQNVLDREQEKQQLANMNAELEFEKENIKIFSDIAQKEKTALKGNLNKKTQDLFEEIFLLKNIDLNSAENREKAQKTINEIYPSACKGEIDKHQAEQKQKINDIKLKIQKTQENLDKLSSANDQYTGEKSEEILIKKKTEIEEKLKKDKDNQNLIEELKIHTEDLVKILKIKKGLRDLRSKITELKIQLRVSEENLNFDSFYQEIEEDVIAAQEKANSTLLKKLVEIGLIESGNVLKPLEAFDSRKNDLSLTIDGDSFFDKTDIQNDKDSSFEKKDFGSIDNPEDSIDYSEFLEGLGGKGELKNSPEKKNMSDVGKSDVGKLNNANG